jgi:hypothetical protein
MLRFFFEPGGRAGPRRPRNRPFLAALLRQGTEQAGNRLPHLLLHEFPDDRD